MGDTEEQNNTSIPTPVSNSPATPPRGYLKRKFEEEPPRLRLPSPIIRTRPTPHRLEPDPDKMICGRLYSLFSRVSSYAGGWFASSGTTADDSPTPPTSPHLDQQQEQQLESTSSALALVTNSDPPPQKSVLDKPLSHPDDFEDWAQRFSSMILKDTVRKRDMFGFVGDSRRPIPKARQTAQRLRGSQYATKSGRPDSQIRQRQRAQKRGGQIDSQRIKRARKNPMNETESLEALISSLIESKVEGFQSWATVSRERERREADIKQLIQLTKRPIVKPLSEEARHQVYSRWNDTNPSKIIISKFRQDITVRDLRTLRGTTWLNDEVINFYLELICQQANRDSKVKRVHAFNTFFQPKLSKKGYSDVARWAKRAGIGGENFLKLHYLIIPVHSGSVHWTLAVANFVRKRVEYYDSLGSSGGSIYKDIRTYLQMESGGKINLDEWTDYRMKGAPQQENGYDCGVFLCKTAEIVSRGLDPIFTQKEITLYRERMAAEIIRGALIE